MIILSCSSSVVLTKEDKISSSVMPSKASASAKVLMAGKTSWGLTIFSEPVFKVSTANSEGDFDFKSESDLFKPEASHLEKECRSLGKFLKTSETIDAWNSELGTWNLKFGKLSKPEANPNDTTRINTAKPEARENLKCDQFFPTRESLLALRNSETSADFNCFSTASRILDFSSDFNSREESFISGRNASIRNCFSRSVKNGSAL